MTVRFPRLRTESDAMLHFDALRFIAAAGVIWHHSHQFLVADDARPALIDRTRGLALFVDLFFVISGFVITYVYRDRIRSRGDYLGFMRRRVGRLIPLHWLTLLLSWGVWIAILLFTTDVELAPNISPICVAHTALLLNGLYKCGWGSTLNGVTWSISAEMALYLALPLLLLFLRRRQMLVGAIVLALAAGYWLSLPIGLWDEVHPVARALPSFLFGMALYAWRDSLRSVPSGSNTVVGLLAGLGFAMMTGLHEWFVLLLVWLLAAAAVAADTRLVANRMVRLVAPLGQLTYGLYMWHGLLVLGIANVLGDKLLHLTGLRMVGLLALLYVMIGIVAYLSLFLVETPARRWIDGLGRQRIDPALADRAASSAAP